jgi:hypothetical protein
MPRDSSQFADQVNVAGDGTPTRCFDPAAVDPDGRECGSPPEPQNVVSDAAVVPALRLGESAGVHDLLEEALTVASPNATAKTTCVVGGMLADADSIDDLEARVEVDRGGPGTRKFHDNAVRSLPEERAAELAARTLALPDAQSVEDLTALLTSAGER